MKSFKWRALFSRVANSLKTNEMRPVCQNFLSVKSCWICKNKTTLKLSNNQWSTRNNIYLKYFSKCTSTSGCEIKLNTMNHAKWRLREAPFSFFFFKFCSQLTLLSTSFLSHRHNWSDSSASSWTHQHRTRYMIQTTLVTLQQW